MGEYTTNAVHILGLFLLTVISAFNTWQNRRHGEKSSAIARDLEVVKSTGKSILTLSNGRFAAILLVNLEFAKQLVLKQRRLVELSNSEEDKSALVADDLVVKQQEALLNAHLQAQAQVELTKLQSLRDPGQPGPYGRQRPL
jgi:hypothetical protein